MKNLYQITIIRNGVEHIALKEMQGDELDELHVVSVERANQDKAKIEDVSGVRKGLVILFGSWVVIGTVILMGILHLWK